MAIVTMIRDVESVGASMATTAPRAVTIKQMGRVSYRTSYAAMRELTSARTAQTRDELWVLEHPPVYTAGAAARVEHFPRSSAIPIERIDRGGQITYHGPGQAIVYCLVDLRRRQLSVQRMVCLMEQVVIDLLADHDILAERKAGAPGVYVDGAKIAALGLRVRNGSCYHGLAFNVDLDLAPFADIDPCGYPGLRVTRTADLGLSISTEALGVQAAERLSRMLS
jgi:lipoyl(octanoyl) transferase